MDIQPASMDDLARRLLAAEGKEVSTSSTQAPASSRVIEKLRIGLTRLAGADGFTSLMRRTLSLARAEYPSLQDVHIRADGALEGFETRLLESASGGVEESVAITAHLLGLLMTFVGEAITLRLVREAWPDALLQE